MSRKLAEKYQPYVKVWKKRLAEEPEPYSEVLKEACRVAEKCARVLAEQYGVRKVYLFGSAAGHGTFHKHSDIDLAVEGLPEQQYLKALVALWDIIPPHISLDLVSLESARPEIAELILSEGILLYADPEILHTAHRHSE